MTSRAMEIHRVAIASLVEDPANARKHGEKNLEAIKGSLARFGQRKPIVVGPNRVVLAGNGTLRAAKALGWTEIYVTYAEDLVGVDAAAYAIADNRAGDLAEWYDENLGAILHRLREVDFDLKSIGFDTSDLDEIFGDGDGNGNGDAQKDLYTKKIKAPIYEPKGDRPPVESLVDLTKAEALLKAITEADIPEEVKAFLRHAAGRHAVFNYEQIAEYYAHAPKEVQELMEASALVIIDFEKAIENGFVSLTEDLMEAYKNAE